MMNQQQNDNLSQTSHCSEEVEQHVVQFSDLSLNKNKNANKIKELVVYSVSQCLLWAER